MDIVWLSAMAVDARDSHACRHVSSATYGVVIWILVKSCVVVAASMAWLGRAIAGWCDDRYSRRAAALAIHQDMHVQERRPFTPSSLPQVELPVVPGGY